MTAPSLSFTGASTRRLPLGDLMAHHAAIDPRAPALTLGGRVVDRATFDALCNRRARRLAAQGVTEGDLVAITLPKGLEFYETVFAAWKLGATPAPLSAALSDLELGAILKVAEPRLAVGVEPGRLPGVRTLASLPQAPGDLSTEALPSRTARYWKAMASGGSTGRPKLIVDHMPGEWDPGEGGIAQQAGDTILNPGPTYHNGPFLGAMLGLFGGGHIVEMDRFDPAQVLELTARHRVNWTFLVPTMMHRIARLPAEVREAHDLSSLRTVLHSAAPCPAWLKRFWIEWLGPERILEVYTGTERQALVTISGDEWLSHPGSVGRVGPGAALRVLDDDGEDRPPGEVGEIFLRPDAGRNATYHYLGAEARARGEWESLGDLGHVDGDGYLYLSDRRHDLIIRGGANIYPAEVEAALDAHPAVASSAVIGLPHEDLGASVHAIVQPWPGREPTGDELREFVSSRLAAYKAPRTFEFVSTPLRDDAGKVRRSALRAERLHASPTTPEQSR